MVSYLYYGLSNHLIIRYVSLFSLQIIILFVHFLFLTFQIAFMFWALEIYFQIIFKMK